MQNSGWVRLLKVAANIMPVIDSYSPLCPICGIELNPEGRLRLDCPGCGNTLFAVQSRMYRVFRIVVVYGTAAIWAWRRGWDPSFIIFVVSFYAIAVFLIFGHIEGQIRRFFPPKRYVPRTKDVQTLGIYDQDGHSNNKY